MVAIGVRATWPYALLANAHARNRHFQRVAGLWITVSVIYTCPFAM